MKAPLSQTVENFARSRQIERELTGEEEAHRAFIIDDDGNTTPAGQNGDPYELIERLAVKLMLGKIRLGNVAGLLIESPAHAIQATTYEEARDTDESQRISVMLTAGHDGETMSAYLTTNEPEKAKALGLEEGTQDSPSEGRLADAIEKVTLALLMAQAIEKRGTDPFE